MTELTREKKLALIWRHTHADFKGKREDGAKVVLVLREGLTWSVPLTSLTDAEIADKLSFSLKSEEKRLAKKKSKMRCNRCHAPMAGTTSADGVCKCGGLIEAAG